MELIDTYMNYEHKIYLYLVLVVLYLEFPKYRDISASGCAGKSSIRRQYYISKHQLPACRL